MTETFDVVVAGAGPVGLMTACELRLAGVHVLVVERLPDIDPTVKAGAINVPTAEAFYRRGLLPQLLDDHAAKVAAFTGGQPGPQRFFVGHFAGITLDSSLVDFDDPAFGETGPVSEAWFVGQQEIERILGARAAELGVEIRRGVELTGFTDDSDCVTIWLGDTAIRAGWLVGCDGGHSLVRKLAGFDFPGLDPLITGHQAVVEMTGAEGLRPGWNFTATGIYVHNPGPGRILTVQVDGPPADRTAPVTAAELQAALRAVSGVPVEITGVRSATRFTDNTRQVTEYRRGRVLLAGDAAHVHSPFGGQGLNLGVGDAVNLGWKLAAVVAGWARPGLLDTYTAERHPVGEWVLEWTRAQIAVMRGDARSRAMRDVLVDLLATRDGATRIYQKISGVLHRYDLGGGHDLVGAQAPDIELSDGTRLGEHCADGRAVLLDLADSPALRAIAAPWSSRVRVVTAKPAQPRELSALLVRPDGFVAWASDGGIDGLEAALIRWFGQVG
ncbi:2-polyprenyl-6-methoxyphenol hydroxylase-like FAD-dependent oxidoreductase [Nocardia transvalensis]|uniref:2-polyprenyl-6-methoxyphenol hydroxylase-like FAD-dependent oxidoreductase n=1 Tax=Nocardia transvalensis TaxID=37333 RepID=A0A7W9PK09_9NOCA|nr:FAD-dependent monooxygenase [Nocardia transvalensis]MBB5916913.1 2-polyprenyl-6-methoxyphenol hydroxylase-like FAD-dependent oxidoreductase [Nocardia transvalensis]